MRNDPVDHGANVHHLCHELRLLRLVRQGIPAALTRAEVFHEGASVSAVPGLLGEAVGRVSKVERARVACVARVVVLLVVLRGWYHLIG